MVHYDSGCIIEKGAEVRHVYAFKIFGLLLCQKSFRIVTRLVLLLTVVI